MEHSQNRALKIARLNDAFRRTFRGGEVVVTAGVNALDRAHYTCILECVQHDEPSPGNDPYGERDFGTIVLDSQKYFWKIDYYDRSRRRLSPDPANPAVTRRVLTVMRADEY